LTATTTMKMHEILRAAADWVLPPKVERLMRRSAERLFAGSLAANHALHNRHAGEKRCFVIGSGPSLKTQDLSLLANEYTIAANSFYKHPDAPKVGLKYLCIGDPHFMSAEPRALDWHRTIEKALPTTTLLLNRVARPIVEQHGLYRNQDVYYVEPSSTPATKASECSLDFTRPLNVGNSTGTLVMIPLAMYLGFREIFLLGFDANWLESFERSYHFYDTHEHFPEFDSVAADTRDIKYEDEVDSVKREFEAHRLLAERSRQLGVRIWNATAGGRVDTYPRTRYEDLFTQRGTASSV
jgi:hypothetical protein